MTFRGRFYEKLLAVDLVNELEMLIEVKAALELEVTDEFRFINFMIIRVI